jgi:hypothetical protein
VWDECSEMHPLKNGAIALSAEAAFLMDFFQTWGAAEKP